METLIILFGGAFLFIVFHWNMARREERQKEADALLTEEERLAAYAERSKSDGKYRAMYWIGFVLFCFVMAIGLAITDQ